MDWSTLVRLAFGVVGTWVGAEMLVRGSARLALRLGLRPFVVGLTVVALGTSSPEAVVSFVAATRQATGIALGNVLGSNIANVGLILGVVCLFRPLRVDWRSVRLDYGLMVAATLLTAVFLYAGGLDRLGGMILLLFLVGSLVYYARSSHRPPLADREEEIEGDYDGARPEPVLVPGLLSLAGLAVLVGGAHLLVRAAEEVALAFGIPEEVIGATMVAVGTSLPELAASVVAVLRGHHEIGIGNILGSNLMNLTFVLGGVCVIAPVESTVQVRTLVLPVMLAFTLVLWPLMASSDHLGRRAAALLLGAYGVFAFVVYYGPQS